MPEERLNLMFDALTHVDHLAILPHNNPDPDAIASAVALQYLLAEKLGLKSNIFYAGIVGRAENRALLRYLGQPLQYLPDADTHLKTPVALLDTQPGAGNNALPSHIKPIVVIDHHPLRENSAGADFVDVRPEVGSVSTMMVQYLSVAGLVPTDHLATALFYGIKTDTMGLERGTGPADREAFCYLLPLVDIEALFEIERAQVPAQYFTNFVTALQGTRIYDNLVISYTGQMDYPDLVAEMADFLLRMEGCQWVLCMGVYQDQLYLSVRSRRQRGSGEMVRRIVNKQGLAGGHGAMAGGQVPLAGQNPTELAQLFSRRALEHLGIEPEVEGRSLA